MGVIAMSLFLGISFLATHLSLVPEAEDSVLSQMTRLVTEGVPGGTLLYYWVQTFTMLILVLAANTGYQDFPRLSYFLARDGFLPRWMQNLGDRLVFSSGILVLAAFASIIVVLFRADEIAMLPLYAIGVMVSFTISQTGMVRLWEKIATIAPGEELVTPSTVLHAETGLWWKRALNATGAVVTFIVLVVLVATKFMEGAWLIVLAIPLLILLFRAIKDHYIEVAQKLRTRDFSISQTLDMADVVIVPIADVHRGTLRALKYAKRLSNNVRAITVVSDREARERIQRRWERFPELTADEQLIFIEYDYRDILEPLIDYIEHVNDIEFPNQLTTVVIPEFVPHSVGEQLLHNQTANILRVRLRAHQDIVVIDIPYHL
jgi:hypothetical protein